MKIPNIFDYPGLLKIINLSFNDDIRSIVMSTFNAMFNSKQISEEEYVEYLYKHKWHPYAGYYLDYQMVKDIMQVKRQVSEFTVADKLIDKIIFSYYTNNVLKDLKLKCDKSITDFRKRIIKQSLSAYLRNEYALTVFSLLPIWNTFINNIVNREIHTINGVKNEHNEIILQQNLDIHYNSFFKDYIFSDCYSLNDITPDVPNRHAVAHGYFTGYPSKKSALNAIIFTDFLMDLECTKII